MNLLLDTCEFLWLALDDPRLRPAYRAAFDDLSNRLYVSAASDWEIAIKHGNGKLQLPSHPRSFLRLARTRTSVRSLPIKASVTAQVGDLPPFHRDPFDRLIVTQAQVLGLTLASSDPLVRQYPVALL